LSFLDRGILATSPGDRNPNEERWWTGGGPAGQSATSIYVTPDVAIRVSALFLGVRLYAETLSTLPLILYREREDGGKDRAKKHSLWRHLRKQPNSWQTAQQWREMMLAHSILWGLGLSEIKFGLSGMELEPLDPDTITVEKLRGTRRRRYVIQEAGEPTRTLLDDQVFRFEGLSFHVGVPESLLRLARESIGLWLARQRYEALYFARGARPSVWLEHPQKLTDPVIRRLQESAQSNVGGLDNMWRVKIAEEGMTVKEVGHNAHDAQLTEAGEAAVHEIARWVNLPAFMLGAGKQPPYASHEAMTQAMVDFSFRPVAVRFEQCISRDLIVEDDVYPEHLFDALLRGDTLARYQAYAQAIMNGFLSENEVRLKENYNPMPGLDQPRRSVNQDRGADPQKSQGRSAVSRRTRLIVQGDAARLVRQEIAAITDKAPQLASKPDEWNRWLTEFYGKQERRVAEALQLEPALAREYAERHRVAVAADLSTIEAWETTAPAELAALALEEEPAHAA
jgi:HK97 family phage portal protein